MSTNTDSPATTRITLTYEEGADAEDSYWIARDDKRGVTVQAPTREEALEALDEAVSNRTGAAEHEWEIDPDDPFFSAPTFSSGQSDVSESADEYLTEDLYRDKVAPDDES
jgi:predicted RNase H-like HicB family nuclease